MITAWDFVGGYGYATTVNALQISSLLKYSPDARFAGAVKPKYTVSSSVNGHYEDPNTGCGADEKAFTIQGVAGEVCAPSCTSAACPTDVPAGVTAAPQCALQDQSGNKYCVLLCTPSVEDDQCGDKASCKSIQGAGVCTYDSR